MVFEHLKVTPLQRATSRWANQVVDAIELAYSLGKRGDPDAPYKQLYGYYGYFFNDLFVAGRRVLKDGDPITLYNIEEPAKEAITQAIDRSKVDLIAQYTSDIPRKRKIEEEIKDRVSSIEEKVVKIRMDEYGNVGVIIAEPIDVYGYVRVRPTDPEEELEHVSDIVDTGVVSPPITILTPPTGKSIDVRRAYLSTNSTSGEIILRFANSKKVITVLWPSTFGFAIVPAIRVVGNVDEPIELTWSDLTAGAKIFYVINYKEA